MFSYHHPIVQEDLQRIVAEPLDWYTFQGKTVLVTGATGMLATYLTFFFLYLNEHQKMDVHVVALCRNKEKGLELFDKFLGKDYFEIIIQDVCDSIFYNGDVDYIFHLAGNASPYAINNSPVDIMKSNLLGTISVLELAKIRNSKVFFASTREVYGKVEGVEVLSESTFGRLDCLENRACYPESKRAAEALLKSYELQYGLDIYIARIAHSYGPGMKTQNDGRIMADLVGNVVRGEDIVLKSDGSAERAFCYITDAVAGIFYIIFKGEAGEAYNLSNETEEISIKELAFLLSELSGGKSKVRFNKTTNLKGYCNYQRIGLDNSKLCDLGWNPIVNLADGITNTIKIYD